MMASKALQITKQLGRKLVNLKKFKAFKFTNHHPKPVVPTATQNQLPRVIQTFQPKRTVWEFGRYLFKVPHLFRRGPFAPIRLGLCIGLAISNKDSIELREIRDVATTCLHSTMSQCKPWEFSSLHQLQTGKFLKKGCQGAIYLAKPTDSNRSKALDETTVASDYPLVMKMLFNYREETNLLENQPDEDIVDIFKAETVPLSYLPPHPSIAKVHGAVVEKVPELPEAKSEFPCALPPSLYPEMQDFCFGEEKTLFLVMQRYGSSLFERIREGGLTTEQTIQVLIQLIEGDIFLKKYGIAHRDLHAKNILIDESEDGSLKACITDFGCATDKLTRTSPQCLKLDTHPGIPALQAPEVANMEDISSMDYRKADLWTIATLVYDMRQPGTNPFMTSDGLDSRFYFDSEIPSVSDVPLWLNLLVQEMLKKNPHDRPSSEFCANVIHLMQMQMPASWIIGDEPSTEEFRDWINLKLVGLILNHRRSHMDMFHLIFCKRLTEKDFRKCLRWLRHNIR